jgi:hypothetical protein
MLFLSAQVEARCRHPLIIRPKKSVQMIGEWQSTKISSACSGSRICFVVFVLCFQSRLVVFAGNNVAAATT